MSFISSVKSAWAYVVEEFNEARCDSKVSTCQATKVPGMAPADADAAITQGISDARAALSKRKSDIAKWDPATAASFKKFFGTETPEARAQIAERIDKQIAHLDTYSVDNFSKSNFSHRDAYAYVHPIDDKKVYLGNPFRTAPATGRDSRAGVIIHELSHFDSISGTGDSAYGASDAALLASKSPETALMTADNFEYFVEDGM